MKVYLVRVSIDQAFGQWNAPVDPDTREFVYVPIPEDRETKFQPGLATTFDATALALAEFAAPRLSVDQRCTTLPDTVAGCRSHLDPDFGWLTYGDNGLRRGSAFFDLAAGDALAFYAGLRSVRKGDERLVYAIIGLFRVAEVARLRDVPRER